MAITIYTYSNPYEIHKEPYWASIQNCFHLCVSQTLVNGLCDQYKEFYKGKLTTVTKFINTLYEDWQRVRSVQPEDLQGEIRSLNSADAIMDIPTVC